ncbi:MAG: COQ9 family protein [Alphaproteobacteria bacterium]|nr:COQ9 family protein [Alphaproteobacteria bacterium]
MSDAEFDKIRDQLVLAVLPHAVFEGWSMTALQAAAADLGLDSSVPERAFLAGPVAAVEHFVALADQLMVEDLAGTDMAALKVPERVFKAVAVRLERWQPHREAIRRALAVLALPGNALAATRVTCRTIDAIWRAAGDTSHDFSWYTKRATLTAVYTATMLYWLDDSSDDGAATLAFLRRRLADVGRVTQMRRKVEGWLNGTGRARRPGRPAARPAQR